MRPGLYEILSVIGAGGMGEVYRARNTKLNRHVAIKVLPESFANDLDRLARFTREARTLTSLNHPTTPITLLMNGGRETCRRYRAARPPSSIG
jgi:serine/threonine protein kinase